MKIYCAQKYGFVEKILRDGLHFDNGISFELFREQRAFRCYIDYGEVRPVANKTIFAISVDAKENGVFVGEGALEKSAPKDFVESFKPLADYKIGEFLLPVCFLTKEMEPEKVELFDKNKPEFRIYDSNERFYTKCLLEKFAERYNGFELIAVKAVLEALVKTGKMRRKEDDRYYIYIDNETGECVPICKKYLS